MKREDGGYDREDGDEFEPLAIAALYLVSAVCMVTLLVWLWRELS